ncbi:hypothetical protein AYI68_g7778 [Smittium mucronatum]|uniref:Uncharacterized protein n=1 Tax=Smittium mucronatum TaxID=133383 RepID=A0A1R0GMT5_9FUNG|nr:hypothetical protein AYI68_g7778 [Smittium mucronatum]
MDQEKPDALIAIKKARETVYGLKEISQLTIKREWIVRGGPTRHLNKSPGMRTPVNIQTDLEKAQGKPIDQKTVDRDFDEDFISLKPDTTS